MERIATCIRLRQPLPSFACENIDHGYNLQKRVTKNINHNGQIGFKAGATSTAVQQHLGLKAPLVGSLYGDGKLQSGCELSLVAGQELECEIGIVVNCKGEPIGLFPAVEVVYLEFSQREDLSIANAVAVNLGADRFICGPISPWQPTLESLTINVIRDGINVATIVSGYSFGSLNEGANWMLGEVKAKKLWSSAEKQSLFLMGTCGDSFIGKKGNYQIDFGCLGNITFNVV